MSTYTTNYTQLSEGAAMMDLQLSEAAQDAIFEQDLIMECEKFTDAELHAFVESDLAQQLIQEGKMRKNTIVMLSKRDDVSRRTKMIAIQAAKDNKDPLYAKLCKAHKQERELEQKIMAKYGNKSLRAAKVQQKDWIKNRMPANFGKFGGADRVSSDAKETNFQRKYGIN